MHEQSRDTQQYGDGRASSRRRQSCRSSSRRSRACSAAPQSPARMARLCRRAGQLPVRRRHPDHQGQRRAAAGRLDVSRRRHRLQSARRPRRDLHAGPRQRARRPRRGHRRAALGVAGDQGLRGARRELLGERRRQGSPAAAQHAEHAAGLRRQHRPADSRLRQGRRGRSARRARPRSGDRRAAEPPARARSSST